LTPDPKQKDGNSRKRFWKFIRRSDGNSIPPLKSAGVLTWIQKTKPTYLTANSNRLSQKRSTYHRKTLSSNAK
jgi:hypothetical protein